MFKYYIVWSVCNYYFGTSRTYSSRAPLMKLISFINSVNIPTYIIIRYTVPRRTEWNMHRMYHRKCLLMCNLCIGNRCSFILMKYPYTLLRRTRGYPNTGKGGDYIHLRIIYNCETGVGSTYIISFSTPTNPFKGENDFIWNISCTRCVSKSCVRKVSLKNYCRWAQPWRPKITRTNTSCY